MRISGRAFLSGSLTNAEITAENGIITHIKEVKSAPDVLILPGLIDVHTHGALGADFTHSGEEELTDALKGYARMGTTSVLATVSSHKEQTMLDAAKRVGRLCGRGSTDRANLLGISMEGPFFCKDKRGAHPEEYLTAAKRELVEAFATGAGGWLRQVCIDPLAEGALELVREYKDKYIISIAHTACGRALAEKFVDEGASNVTHLLNAMGQPTSREPGVLACIEKDCTLELIADGVHVDGFWVRLLFNTVKEKLMLISDSSEGCGMPDGQYVICGQRVKKCGGRMLTEDGRLAGSASWLMDGLKCAVSMGVPLEDAVRAASVTPAKRLGVSKGDIRLGYDADLLICDDALNIKEVYIGGEIIE